MSGRSVLRALVLCGAALVLFAGASPSIPSANAQTSRSGPLDVHAELDVDTVELGDSVHLTLRASSATDELDHPSPGSNTAFTIANRSISPTTSVSIVNGRVSQKRGVTAIWTLTATKLGSFMIGPPTVEVGGRRVAAGERLTVKVVARGQAPKRPQQPQQAWPFSGSTPFDPWKAFDDDDEPKGRVGADDVQTDPKLALDAARGTGAFLHATVDKTRAVVGEQVTHSIYLYVDLGEREPAFNDVHEPSTPAFLKHPLVSSSDGQSKTAGIARVAGRLYAVKLIRRSALFALKAGDHALGPMKLGYVRNGQGKGAARESESLSVHVEEPPLAGRPPGYALGDVGRFGLTADVTPKKASAGGVVGVAVTLSGIGNLTHELTVPRSNDVEWLDPEVHDETGVKDGDRFGGTRTFRYIVRLNRPGNVDLGEVRLPYFDAEAKKYAVASVALGTVSVDGSSAPATASSAATNAPVSPLAKLPRVAVSREPKATVRTAFFADSVLYPVFFGAGPLTFALAYGGAAATAFLRGRRRAHAARPETELAEKKNLAKSALANAGEAIGPIERYLATLVRSRTGVDPRGVTRDALQNELVAAGLSDARAESIVLLSKALEDARFSPEGAKEARALFGDVEALERVLEAVVTDDDDDHEDGSREEEDA